MKREREREREKEEGIRAVREREGGGEVRIQFYIIME